MNKVLAIVLSMGLASMYARAQSSDGSGGSRAFGVAYSISTGAVIGLQATWMPTGSGLLGGSGFGESAGVFVAGRYNSRNILHFDRLSITAGGTLQMWRFLHVYLGAGYGQYRYPYNEPAFWPDLEISGLELEGGLAFAIKSLTLFAGVSNLAFQQLDITGGIGYTFK